MPLLSSTSRSSLPWESRVVLGSPVPCHVWNLVLPHLARSGREGTQYCSGPAAVPAAAAVAATTTTTSNLIRAPTMPHMEEIGRRLVALLEKILAGQREDHAAQLEQVALQRELIELVRPSFAGRWSKTTVAFGVFGLLGVLAALAQFFRRPTLRDALRFLRDVFNRIGRGGSYRVV
ncbi:hypothetical protein DL763_005770 [Monosporascus cannonballus]|nr:hypothetical protein DL763_005770 [Monosporascus cannonballus]